jgi:Domain of unknown function (DUF4153)
MHKLLLVGAIQGWALWGIWKARELNIWPHTDIISERSLLYLALALPLAYYLTESIVELSRQRRRLILISITVFFPLLGAYSGWADHISIDTLNTGDFPFARPSDLMAAGVLGFALIPLLVHFNLNSRSWSYLALFETAWRNVILCASAGFLTGLFWMVLFAGSELLKLIGLNFAHELIQKAIFAIPVSGIVFATAYAMTLAKAEMVITLRRFQLSLLAWLLPLLLIFVLVWVVAVPFTGVDLLFKTHSAAFILLWCTSLCISFVNAAYQDGLTTPPYGKVLSKLLAWAWLGLPVVVAVAAWAIWLRIAQHGWTEDRVWGVFVLLMAAIYVAGYAASAFRSNSWMASIGKTNMWAAVVLCGGLIVLTTPIADARRIAVSSQMQRLMGQTGSSANFDFNYLRWEAGKYGHNALLTLQAGIDHPERDVLISRAKQMLAQKNRYQADDVIKTLSVAEAKARMRALPKSAQLSDKLITAIRAESKDWSLQQCFKAQVQCAVWLVDLNADRALDAVILVQGEWGNHVARVMENQQGNYQKVGSLYLPRTVRFDNLLEQIEHGEFKIAPPRWREIEFSGKRFQITLDKATGAADFDDRD